MDCKVQIDQCKLQSISGSATDVTTQTCNCQFAMSTLQFAIAPSRHSSHGSHARPPRTEPSSLARGGNPETEREEPSVAPDGAVVSVPALLKSTTRTVGTGLGCDVAWALRVAQRNS
ncbi:hypothetical protein RB8333 [Rhodopirellula baltica SH 1]|uniref:Uncharacterized protein n=1 Tax=Rhodopirellula baltica (strain DSM 10527 / NCIMB 13988 / SH1) TaxID=243090 RepID=Q7UFU4_RHOBA|nr:hypothetical protein RB8333 [Rhodopirellula baltica SH 1]